MLGWRKVGVGLSRRLEKFARIIKGEGVEERTRKGRNSC